MALSAASEALEIGNGDLVESLLRAHHVENEYCARDKPDEDEDQYGKPYDAAQAGVIIGGTGISGSLLRKRLLHRPRGQIPDDAAHLIRVHVSS